MKNKLNLIVTLITISIFLFTTIGYAAYGARLGFTGNVYVKGNGEIAITNVVLDTHSNLSNPTAPVFTKDSITFDLNFNVASNSNLDDDYYATYEITLSNTTFYDYEFASAVFTPSVETLNDQNMTVSYDVDGIDIGENIPKLTTKTFTLTIHMYPKAPGNYNVGGESNVDVEQEAVEPVGSLLASLPKNSQVNLRNSNVRDKVTVSVINSFDTAKGFNFSINNSNFKLVNANGNTLGSLTIPANTTQDFDVYFEKNGNISFATDYQTANLVFNKNDGSTNLGSVKILVDKDETLLDDQAPIISDVQASFVADNGKVNVTWSATDINNITDFIVDVCNSSNECTSYNTGSTSRNYTATGLSNGTYYFKVYGIDSKGNNGKTQATTCTQSEGYCSRSTSSNYKWVFDVTYNLDNYVTKSSGPDTVVINNSFTATFTLGNNRQYNNVTVTMGGNTLTSGSGGYTWNANQNRMTINSVTGDIVVTITTSSTGNICNN